ncbi:cation:proton antiporter subunit C [Sulfidibacter corallicola]|uniref:Cation:proton antiporter subunit C n=1 Tax=Sulfidibacter corallicola TaxID=2818388 RepID=A0A8A4THN6_SULCO|nr:cation:proton antiporter subunit C [Sulfidibacter corallicola]QTD49569.1 cation:proton antiporter subunit C [Sulfidibacter corallicola]
MLDLIIAKFNYWVYIVLMMIGLYAMIAKNNYIKKLIGMTIFQTAIMLFYVSIGAKQGATIPIIDHHGDGGDHGEAAEAVGHAVETAAHAAGSLDPDAYVNPLPHVLMLTAIVVGVATLGVAMAVVQKIHDQYGSIEEDEVLKRIKL